MVIIFCIALNFFVMVSISQSFPFILLSVFFNLATPVVFVADVGVMGM